MKNSEIILAAGYTSTLPKGSILPEVPDDQLKTARFLEAIPKPKADGDKIPGYLPFTCREVGEGEDDGNLVIKGAETFASIKKAVRALRGETAGEKALVVVLRINDKNFPSVIGKLRVYDGNGYDAEWPLVESLEQLAKTPRVLIDPGDLINDILIRTGCQIGIGSLRPVQPEPSKSLWRAASDRLVGRGNHKKIQPAPGHVFSYRQAVANGSI